MADDDDDGPVPDAAAVAAAEALLVRVSERAARIRGTDAPKRSVSLTGQAGPPKVLAFIEAINPEEIAAAVATMQHKVDAALRDSSQDASQPCSCRKGLSR